MNFCWSLLGRSRTISMLFVVSCLAAVVSNSTASEGNENPPVCTAIGCGNHLAVRIGKLPDRAKYVVACAEGVCVKRKARRIRSKYSDGHVHLALSGDPQVDSPSKRVHVTLKILDGKSRELESDEANGATRVLHPNGRECLPHCHRVAGRFSGGRLTLYS